MSAKEKRAATPTFGSSLEIKNGGYVSYTLSEKWFRHQIPSLSGSRHQAVLQELEIWLFANRPVRLVFFSWWKLRDVFARGQTTLKSMWHPATNTISGVHFPLLIIFHRHMSTEKVFLDKFLTLSSWGSGELTWASLNWSPFGKNLGSDNCNALDRKWNHQVQHGGYAALSGEGHLVLGLDDPRRPDRYSRGRHYDPHTHSWLSKRHEEPNLFAGEVRVADADQKGAAMAVKTWSR